MAALFDQREMCDVGGQEAMANWDWQIPIILVMMKIPVLMLTLEGPVPLKYQLDHPIVVLYSQREMSVVGDGVQMGH